MKGCISSRRIQQEIVVALILLIHSLYCHFKYPYNSLPLNQRQPFFQSNIVNVDTSSGVIYYTNCSTVGTKDDFHEGNVFIYPNPGSNILNVEFKNHVLPGEIKIFNYSGVRVLSAAINDNILRLDISILPSGMYLAEISDGFNMIYRKIVKLN